ncbi:hypothetical protein BP6252_01917 [Coleophoma cylindrospora]|uniref:Fungal N-terminal domain-containing protein n=1 Tax=Coleophoma cylindrospora TaxID=1849047 RepID=A0A3D8SDB0_9HELO|nr:hypothetical protein BP6252_01917 [Coleophoma cylindrospora]
MEAVGAAASIAGIIGLTGQVMTGCLAIKEFVGDAKHAPAAVQALRDSIRTVQDATEHTKSCLEQIQRSGIMIAPSAYETAFKECLDTVIGLRSSLDKFGFGSQKRSMKAYWMRVAFALEKGELEEQLARLESAKGQVIIAQNNIGLILKSHSISSMRMAEKSLAQIEQKSQVAASELECLKQSSTQHTLRLERNHTSLDTNFAAVNLSINDIQQDIANLPDTLVRVMGPSLQGILQSAVENALQAHHNSFSINEPNDRDAQELQREMSSKLIYSRSAHRRQLLHESRYNALLFYTDIQTFEQRQYASSLSESSGIFKDQKQRLITSYQIRSRLPFLRYGLDTRAGFSVGRQLQFHGVFTDNSPILEAIKNLDLVAVKFLLDNNQTSLQDRHAITGCSLSDMAVKCLEVENSAICARQYTSKDFQEHRSRIKEGIKLLGFLSQFSQISPVITKEFLKTALLYQWLRDPAFDESLVAVLDTFLADQELDADYLYYLDPLTMRLNETHSNQEVFDELTSNYHSSFLGMFIENNALMLLDPEGYALNQALLRNMKYAISFHLDSFQRRHHTTYGMEKIALPHVLISMYSSTTREDLKHCYTARLKLLLSFGHDLRAQRLLQWETLLPRPISAVELALRLNKDWMLEKALLESGWSVLEVENLFDEERYRGIEEIFTGINYNTREENRRSFMRYFCYHGEWVRSTPTKENKILDYLVSLTREIDVNDNTLHEMVKGALSNCKTAMPGHWPNDTKELLLPGIDFGLPAQSYYYLNGTPREQLYEWPCVQEILSEAGVDLTDAKWVHTLARMKGNTTWLSGDIV